MLLWRISEWADLSGIGGEFARGRWHEKGQRITYLASSRSLAMLEAMVHFEENDLPPDFQLLEVEAPDDLATAHWPGGLTGDLEATRRWGSAWLSANETALASVPSAVAPGDMNWLLNPAHRDASRIQIVGAVRHPWDRRLFG